MYDVYSWSEDAMDFCCYEGSFETFKEAKSYASRMGLRASIHYRSIDLSTTKNLHKALW